MGGSKEAEPGAVLYRAKVRSADGREARSSTAIVTEVKGGPEVTDEEGKPVPVLYRFKVRTADGREVTSAIALAPRKKFEASDLRWGGPEHRHGAETTMRARVAGHDGGPLRFVVQHNHGGRWQEYATVPASVENGEAVARLQVQHPAAGSKAGNKKVQFRFRLEKGAAPR
jgi:hypothetical protein